MCNIILNLQIACVSSRGIPSRSDFLRWLYSALSTLHNQTEITIRLVDEMESRKLNFIYRGHNKSTNVLSFPFENPPEIKTSLLGDLVICCQVVEREAQIYRKTLEAHWAHTVIHGLLHLLGYNHMLEKEANEMESIEIKLMKNLGYLDPYCL